MLVRLRHHFFSGVTVFGHHEMRSKKSWNVHQTTMDCRHCTYLYYHSQFRRSHFYFFPDNLPSKIFCYQLIPFHFGHFCFGRFCFGCFCFGRFRFGHFRFGHFRFWTFMYLDVFVLDVFVLDVFDFGRFRFWTFLFLDIFVWTFLFWTFMFWTLLLVI